MELNLYVVSDSDNVINKTMSNKLTININLKRDVDISSPSLILLDGKGGNYSNFNYAEIVELKRFYFIDNIQRMTNEIIKVDLVCDVLETYKVDVLASRARFNRAIKTGDYYSATVDKSALKTITKHLSNVSIEGNSSMILTSVGEI